MVTGRTARRSHSRKSLEERASIPRTDAEIKEIQEKEGKEQGGLTGLMSN